MKNDYIIQKMLKAAKIPFFVAFLILTLGFYQLGLSQEVTGPSVCDGSTLYVKVVPAKSGNNSFGLYQYDGSTYTLVDQGFSSTNNVVFAGQNLVGEYQVYSFPSALFPPPADPIAAGTYLGSMFIWANPVPVIGGETNPCFNYSETYTTAAGMSGYVWSVSNGTIVSGGTSGDDFVEVNWNVSPGTGNVTVSYTDGNGCSADTPTIYNIDVKHPVYIGSTGYSTLQAAINAATVNDLIEMVCDHTEGFVAINKDITIDGGGNTLTSTSSTYGLAIQSTGIIVQNITVDGAGTFGIHQQPNSGDLWIENTTVENGGGTGFALNCSDNTTLKNITSTGNLGNGVSITNCTNVTIDGITTSLNAFSGGFSAGIGIFSNSATCSPDGTSGVTLTGTVNIAEPVQVYEQATTGTITNVTLPTSFTHYLGFNNDKYYYESLNNTLAAADFTLQTYPALKPFVYVRAIATGDLYVDAFTSINMSIQAAVNVADEENVITVYAGTFTEQVHVNINDLTIIGTGKASTTIKSPTTLTNFFMTGTNKNYPIVFVDGVDTFTLEDLTVDGDGKGNANYRFQGIGFWNSGGTVQNVDVLNIIDTPFSGAQHGVGVYAYNDGSKATYSISCSNMVIEDYQKNAMALSGAGLTIALDNITTIGAGPTSVTAQNGIQIGFGAGGTITNSSVSGNIYTGSGWSSAGILLYSVEPVAITNTSVSDNYVGVDFNDASGSFIGGSVTNTNADSWDAFYIRNLASKGANIGGNLPGKPMQDASPLNDSYTPGKSKGSFSVTLQDLAITGHGKADSWGIYIGANADQLTTTITGCSVSDWGYGIIAYENGGTVTGALNGNLITNNNLGFYAYSVLSQDATNNWWGDATGPFSDPYNTCGLGNEVFGTVTFWPWCVDDDCSASVTLPVINITNSPATYYCKIQDAIDDAADGDEIEVADGIYVEQLHITTPNLTLTGASINNTIIKSPSTLTAFYNSGTSDNYPVIFVDGGDGFALKNLTVDGDKQGNNNYRFQGIAYWNAGGIMKDLKVINIMDNPFSGSQHGVAVYTFNNTGFPYSIDIDNVDVTDFQKNAFAINGNGLTVTMANCDVVGAGPTTVTAQNGIQIWGEATIANISDCTVDGINYTGSGWSASGVLLYYLSNVTINNVDVSSSQVSFYIYGVDNIALENSDISTLVATGVYVKSLSPSKGAVNNDIEEAQPFGEESTTKQFSNKSSSTILSITNSGIYGSYNTSSRGIGFSANSGSEITATITQCTIDNMNYGILGWDYGAVCNLTLNENIITNTNTLAVYNPFNQTWDATCNWWGTSDYNDILPLVYGDVDFSSYLLNDIIDPNDPGYSCGGATWLVYNETTQTWFPTIQDAIDAAVDNDVISAGTDTFYENIEIDKPLTLQAGSSPVIDGGGSGVVITISSNNVTLNGLTIQNGGQTDPDTEAGILVFNSNFDITGVTIQNCTIQNNATGIAIVRGTANTIQYNVIRDNIYNVGIAKLSESLPSTNNVVFDNEIYNCAVGVYVDKYCAGNEIEANEFNNFTHSGIYLWATQNNVVTDNMITGNNVTGSSGIQMAWASGNVISGNTIQDNDYGIQMRKRIYGGNTIENNIIINNDSSAVIFHDLESPGGDNEVANVSCNWWGSADYNDIYGLFEGNVDFAPYLLTSTIDPNDPNFDCGGFVWLVYNVDQDLYYPTIQDAIDDAGTDNTIMVAAGYYEENLAAWKDMEITKSLTLKGAGSGQTIVGLSEGKMNGVEIRGAGLSVTIEGITFTKRPTATYAASFGLRIGETSSSFNSFILRDVEVAYAQGRNVFFGAAGSYENVLFEDCNFHHAGSWGVTLAGPVDGLVVKNSGFTHNGQVDASQGIGLDFTAPGPHQNILIENSDFSHNLRRGINALNIKNAVVRDVTANNNGTSGFQIWNWAGNTENVLFENCTVTGNGQDGVQIAAESGLSVSGITFDGGTYSNNARNNIRFHNGGGTVEDITIKNATLSRLTSSPGSANAVVFVHTVNGITFENNNFTQEQIHWNVWLMNLSSGAVVINGNIFNGTYGVAAWTNMNTSLLDVSSNAFLTTERGLYNHASNNPYSAPCNWWGTEDSHTIAGMIDGDIDFLPFLVVDNISGTTYPWDNVNDYSCDGIGPVVNQTQGTSYMTIQSAIDNAYVDDTILVSKGIYEESLYIYVDGLTLLGPNVGIDPNGLTPRVTESVIKPTEWYGIYITAANVTLDGFTLDGQGTCDYGIYAYISATGNGGHLVTNNIVKNITTMGFIGWVQSGPASSQNYITNNLFHDIEGRAIVALWNYYANMTDNVIHSTAIGLYAENANQPESTGLVEWKNNTISSSRSGIWYNLAYGTATPLTIKDNTIDVEDNASGTRWDGMWLTSLGGSLNPVIRDNIITGGTVTQQTNGYHLWHNTTTATNGITIDGGTVSDVEYGIWINNWDGYPTSGGSNAGTTSALIDGVEIDNASIAGIYLKDNPLNTSGPAAFVYAKVTNSTISNSGIGLLVEGEDASADVIDNPATITGNEVGIRAKDGASLASVTGNIITDNTHGGIIIESTAGTIGGINNNTIAGNGTTVDPVKGLGLQNDKATVVDATNNWWGDASGPYHSAYNTCGLGNAVVGLVDISPWLNGVGGSPVELPIENSAQGKFYCTIQDAINDADPGDIIEITVASHTEGPQIVVNKNLTLKGLGKNATTLFAAGNTGITGDARGWILVQSGVVFNMEDLTMDGNGKNIMQAVRSHGTGTIDNIAFNDINHPGYNGIAVVAFGNTTVQNSDFTNIGRVGISFFGTGCTDGQAIGITYTGKGSGDWIDYAVEIGGGAIATITNCTVSGNTGVALSDGSTSAGILASTYYGAGTTATITGSTFTGNTTAIYVGYNASDVSSVIANNNKIYGNNWGVISSGPTVNAANNWWGSITGPTHADNICGLGDAVTDNVVYDPWYNDDTFGFLVYQTQVFEVGGTTALCVNESTDITLTGSQDGDPNYQYVYTLYENGDPVTGSETNGTGNPLSWTVTPTAYSVYTVIAVNSLFATCEIEMDGAAQVFSGPVTTAGSVLNACPGSQIQIPVTVTSLAEVGAISLTMNYDPTVLTFLSSVSPVLGTALQISNTVFGGTGTIIASWYVAPSGTPLTLPDGSELFLLNFTYNGGTTDLIWNDTDPAWCEYAAFAPNYMPFCDVPTEDYYINGQVTQVVSPVITSTVTSPDGNIAMESGNNYALTICSGEEVTTSAPSSTSADPSSCGALRIQVVYTTDISSLPATETFDLPYAMASLLDPTSITPENHDGVAKDIVFVSTPYYDVNNNGQLDVGDLAGLPITFVLTVQPTPEISGTVTAPGYSQEMVSGESYAHTICSGIEITTSVPTLTSELATACGTLRIQTVYTSLLPNIPSNTIDVTYEQAQLLGPQTISPENHTGSAKTITFVSTPYYDADNSGTLSTGDITGAPTTFVLTVNPIPAVTAVDLLSSTDLLDWDPVNGDLTNGYNLCIDPAVSFFYLDIDDLTAPVTALATGSFENNAFYLVGNYPQSFFDYWESNGVDVNATGWQGVMWNIINGDAPMFYINYTGTDYQLLDGLQYQIGQGANPLRISGDYPQDTYTFEGTVTDVNGCESLPFEVSIDLNTIPVVNAVTLLTSIDEVSWSAVGGDLVNGYNICIDQDNPYHYLDIDDLSGPVNQLMTSSFTQNEFKLTGIGNATQFFAYWAAKGVNASAVGGWEEVMWKIITGVEPMFYIQYTGSDYKLIDGLQYLIGQGAQTLRITGDYPQDLYTFNGSVTDVNGCVSSFFDVFIQINTTPHMEPVANQVFCAGETVPETALSANVPGASFTWTNSNPDIGLVANGTGDVYTFTATNTTNEPISGIITVTPLALSGCIGTPIALYTISVNPTPTMSDPDDQVVCNNGATDAVVFAGPVAGTTYAWVNDTPSIGLAANGIGNIDAFTAVNTTYATVVATITVTPSANDCEGVPQTFTITVHPTPDVANPGNQVLCNGSNTTAVNFTGNVAGTVFDWVNDTPSIGLDVSGTGDIASFTAVNNGTTDIVATITVTPSANGCPGTAESFTITVYPTPAGTAAVTTPITCTGGTATVTITATVGTAPFSYTFNSVTNTTGVFENIPAGTGYEWSIEDVYGCVSTIGTLDVTEPDGLSADVSSTDVTCFGADDGTITVSNAQGGFGTYEYTIDGGANWQSTGIFTGLEPITYDVRVRDAAYPACELTVNGALVITEPAAIGADVAFTLVTCNGAANGTITITNPVGGYGTYEYTINGTDWFSDGNFTGLAPTTYTVQIRDGLYISCVTTLNGALQITEPGALTATVNVTVISCNGADDAAINITLPSGGYGNYEYTINAGINWFVSGSFTSLAPGTYDVRMRDADHPACEVILDGNLVIAQPAAISVSGTVKYYNALNTVMNNVNVELWQGSTKVYPASGTVTTNGTGYYSFPNVCPGDYVVKLSTGKPVGGINSTDAAQVNAWVVSPYSIEKAQFFAGDVNDDNRILSGDASFIQLYFLNFGTIPFPTPWTFWRTNDFITSNPVPYPPVSSFSVLSINVPFGSGPITQNFWGMASGDFNGSFTPGGAKTASESLSLNYGKTIKVDVNTQFELPLYAGKNMEVGAVSLILNFPSEKLEVNGVYLNNDPNTPVDFNVIGDELRISWYSLMPLNLAAGDALVTLQLTTTDMLGLDAIYFILAPDDLNELADGAYNVIGDALLVVDVIESLATSLPGHMISDEITFANHPNPFRSSTTFTYDLPADGRVTLEVYSSMGEKVMNLVDEVQSAGRYKVTLDDNNLKPGVYGARLILQADKKVFTRTITLIRHQ